MDKSRQIKESYNFLLFKKIKMILFRLGSHLLKYSAIPPFCMVFGILYSQTERANEAK